MCGKTESARSSQSRKKAETNDRGRQKNARNDILMTYKVAAQ